MRPPSLHRTRRSRRARSRERWHRLPSGRRILILSASVGSGHNMAAAALEAGFTVGDEVEEVKRIDVLETTNEVYRTFYDDTYFKLVDAAPWLVGWGYDISDPPFKLGNSASVWDRINTTAVVRMIKSFRPDIVVCTHFLPARMISLMISRKALDCRLSAVTTDYDFAGLWLSSPFNRYFVARRETAAFMSAIGVPADRVTVSGIPVRPELAEPIDRREVLGRLGLDTDVPALLISAGAAGGSYTSAIIRQTLRMTSDFTAIVVCGRNAELKSEIDAVVGARTDQYRVLGFTTEMADLMRAATLFVGKPGGLSSSEAMAAGLPMVLIKPIPGQEDRNSDYLLEEGAAVRCNYESTVGHKIDELLSSPGRVAQMAANARRIGHPHAVRDIDETVLAEPPERLWISRAARASILEAYESGVATADLGGSRRTRTLFDANSGSSLAVLTADQISRLSPFRLERYTGDLRVRITAGQLADLNRRSSDSDLVLTLRNLIGESPDLDVEVR
jgi:processive 1,2-diacylglycerol beta-glucosyltransferase